MGESADRFSAALDDLIDRTRHACDEGTTEGARHLRDQARVNAPEWTGQLKGDIKSSPAKPIGDDRFEAVVSTDLVYSRMQEFGGDVKPTTHAFMRIPTGYGVDRRPRDPGHDVYGKVFKIPGTHYMQRAIDESADEIEQIYVDKYTEAFGA